MSTGYKLYDTLGVQKSASQQEIKRAYHRLALECHPDKAGEAGTERFKEVQNAYSMLSDGAKRQMYDRVGDAGLSMAEGGGLGSVVHHPLFAALALSFAWIVSLLLIIFLALACVKIDSEKDWSWGAVFTPIWILDAVPLGMSLFLILMQFKDFDKQSIPAVALLTCCAVVPIPIVLALEGHVSSWTGALTPLLIAIAVAKFQVVRHTTREGHRMFLAMQNMCETDVPFTLYAASNYTDVTSTAIAALLLCIRLDDGASYSYVAVVIPIVLSSLLKMVMSSVALKAVRGRQNDDRVSSLVAAVASLLITFGLPIAFLFLFAVYLDGHSVRFSVVCFPPLMVLSIVNLVTCCGACTMAAHARNSMGDDFTAAEEGHSHHQPTSPADETVYA